MKVQSLLSPKSNQVANQFEILDNNKRIFQSYSSIIAEVSGNIITLDPYYYNYSRTTSKYLAIFLDNGELLQTLKKFAKNKSIAELEANQFCFNNTIIIFKNLN